MKLIAKKGTALEQTLRVMCEKMTESFIAAQDMVKKATGVKPQNIFHRYHWGTISRLVPEFDIHPDDRVKIDPHILRKQKGCDNVYVPAMRYKKGRELYTAFCEYAKAHEVTEEPLNEYGINMVNNESGVSYYIQPMYDKDADRYLLFCSDSIPKAFNKKKLAKDQFEIEY